ncbi:MAG: sulfotransferase [Phycisphaerales bacterium]|nr:MAG: sulfotransferase [Phycisphaerales bacterium]
MAREVSRARDLLSVGDVESCARAASLCGGVIAALPGHAEAHEIMGRCLQRLQRPMSAVEMFERAASIEPRNPVYLAAYASALAEVGEQDEAHEVWTRAAAVVAKKVRDPAARFDAELSASAAALTVGAFESAAERAGRLVDDEKLFHAASERDRAVLLGVRAEALTRSVRAGNEHEGGAAAAREAFDAAIAAVEPHGGASLAGVLAVEASYGLGIGRQEEAVGRLRSFAVQAGEAVVSEGKVSRLLEYACKVLGRAEEEAGDLRAAWHAYRVGNAAANGNGAIDAGPDWSASVHRETVGRLMRGMDAARVGGFARAPSGLADEAGVRPVFIVGVPRSGTSLVEQVVAAHPGAVGRGELQGVWNAARWLGERVNVSPTDETFMGELNEADLADRAARYLAGHARAADADAEAAPLRRAGTGTPTVVTDKMPNNFLNLHVIWQLFPGAKVVWCVRDPADACFSCWSTPFRGDLPYTRDLELMSAFHREHDRLRAFWTERGLLDVHVVRYESLVREPEVESRALLAFLGLDWDASVLEFWRKGRRVLTASSEQATRPIYAQSIGRAARFAMADEEIGELVSGLHTR